MVDPKTIQRCPRFAGVSPNAIAWLAERLTRKYYEKRSNVFTEGETCNRLYLIERGAVKVFKNLESGRELILNIFRSGESVGEVALIDNDVFPASAMASEDSFILEMKKSDYFDLGNRFPEILLATIRDLTQRVRAMTQRLHEIGSGSVDARLAQLFLSLQRSGRITPVGVEIPFVITRQELADMIGVRIETVIRTMSRWQKEQIVLTEKSGFLVPRPNNLEDILKQAD